MTFTPWQFIAVAIAGWMNQQQQDAIAYLREENRILREKLGRNGQMIANKYDGSGNCTHIGVFGQT